MFQLFSVYLSYFLNIYNIKVSSCSSPNSKKWEAEHSYCYCSKNKNVRFDNTVKILCIGTDRSQQTVQTKIRLLLKKQSDQGLRCLPLHQLLLDSLMQCYIKLYQF